MRTLPNIRILCRHLNDREASSNPKYYEIGRFAKYSAVFKFRK